MIYGAECNFFELFFNNKKGKEETHQIKIVEITMDPHALLKLKATCCCFVCENTGDAMELNSNCNLFSSVQ